MGVYNCQLFNNLGLCCFYAQQYDMTLTSFERALSLAENEEEAADVWYNLGHIAVVCCSSHRTAVMEKVAQVGLKALSGIVNPGSAPVLGSNAEASKSHRTHFVLPG